MNIDKLLDVAKSKVFLSSKAFVHGPILCSTPVLWNEDITTARTNFKIIEINPNFFTNLTPDTRVTVLIHELDHIARLHLVRKGIRTNKRWNVACDISINNELYRQGYSFKGVEYAWHRPELGDITPEQIYDMLPEDPAGGAFADDNEGDLFDPDPKDITSIVNTVVMANTQAKMRGYNTAYTEEIDQIINGFFASKIDWKQFIRDFFTKFGSPEYSMSRPNRRSFDFYLPGRNRSKNKLTNLTYYIDTSCSMTHKQEQVIISEIVYVKKTYNPEIINIVQFDTRIHSEQKITSLNQLTDFNLVGRGGTSLRCVHEHIEKTKPTAAIIFSDLDCTPMHTLSFKLPIFWVILDNPRARVYFGKPLHIKADYDY